MKISVTSTWHDRPVRRILALALLVLGAGCASVSSVTPDVDLEAPGWEVRTGQALWKRRGGQPALAGEVIVARHENGDVLVSFSKPPVPIFTARITGREWRIDFVDRGRSLSGKGHGPKRFVWLRLPELLKGAAPPRGWRFERAAEDEWTLSHEKSGERIRLVLDPSSNIR